MRDVDRNLRESQNREYEESLKRDREREERRRLEDVEKRRVEAAAREKDAQEREIIERERREVERKEREATERQLQSERFLDDEPLAGPGTATVAIRLSDGQRLTRRFLKSDKLASLFLFVGAKEPSTKYNVVTHFPRRILTDASISLEEAGLGAQGSVFVEEIVDLDQ